MKIETSDTGAVTVTVRQSWLNDATTCAERGRRMIIDPTRSITADSAAIGTTVHAGIEAAILGNDVGDAMLQAWDEIAREPIKRTLGWSDHECVAEAVRMFRMWDRDIRPHIGDPVHVEHGFNVHWFDLRVGDRDVAVRISGTIDLITTTSLWDWKTAGRKYSAKEKQDTAIQPTAYAVAANRLELLDWPCEFTYGVMVRGKDETQMLSVRRTRNHEVWLARLVEPLVRQAVLVGTDNSWPVNDTHSLCSERWCSWWADCKGAALAPTDLHQPTIKEK